MLIIYNFWSILCQILKFDQVIILDIIYNLLQIEYSKWQVNTRPRPLFIFAGSAKNC